MKRTKTKVGNILKIICYTFLLLLALLLISSLLPINNSFKFFAVTSGSMEPVIPVGSTIFVFPTNSYKVNDIITFRPFKNSPKIAVTHRIVGIQQIQGKQYFVTKGDANGAFDLSPADPSSIVGKKNFIIPYLGYILSFARTAHGLLLVIIIPIIIIIGIEVNKIRKEIQIIVKNRRRPSSSADPSPDALAPELSSSQIKTTKSKNVHKKSK